MWVEDVSFSATEYGVNEDRVFRGVRDVDGRLGAVFVHVKNSIYLSSRGDGCHVHASVIVSIITFA